ncbi:MAG: adenylyltransferase/cytidyltransferase family protein [Nitrososphaerota archaeon]
MAKKVLVSGVFDLIHPGHILFLEKAKKIGGKNSKLIVVIARDSTVLKFKGVKPIFNERIRKRIVSSLKPVDVTILGFKKFSIEKIVKKIKPDIIVFGYDQIKIMKEFERICKEKNWNIKIVRLKKFRSGQINSSSQIVKKIIKLRGHKF